VTYHGPCFVVCFGLLQHPLQLRIWQLSGLLESNMYSIVMTAIAVVCAVGWLCEWVAVRALVYLICEKGITLTQAEIRSSVRAVLTEMFGRY